MLIDPCWAFGGLLVDVLSHRLFDVCSIALLGTFLAPCLEPLGDLLVHLLMFFVKTVSFTRCNGL